MQIEEIEGVLYPIMIRQFTATVYVIDDEKVLLIKHRKLNKWLPPGGHLEANETPPQGALREALEETGLELELFQQENLWIERWNAKSFARPYMCLIEEIPAFGQQPAHQHIDMIYVGKPKGKQKTVENQIETDGLRWFSLQELSELSPDVDIFEETLQTIRHIFQWTKRDCTEYVSI